MCETRKLDEDGFNGYDKTPFPISTGFIHFSCTLPQSFCSSKTASTLEEPW